MRALCGFLCIAIFVFVASADAQTKQDEAAVRALPQAFSEAFNKHDGHALATIMADDVDFVTVGLTWLHGRADFEKYHTRLMVGRFKEITHTVLETRVRFIRPDVAMVHHSWAIQGDKNVDGSARCWPKSETRSGSLQRCRTSTDERTGGEPRKRKTSSPIVVPIPK